VLHTNVDPHEAAESMRAHRNHLTELARQGDFQAFTKLQHSLSRDPVDLEIEWTKFQREVTREKKDARNKV
jgi:hypothetical protein